MKVHTLSSYVANVYIIETGSGAVLVDTGFARSLESVKNGLAKLGFRSNDLKLIVITHAHVDHLGSAAALRRWSGAPLALNAADRPKASAGGHTLPSGRGVIGRAIERAANVLGLKFRYEAFSPDILLEEGQSMDAFGLEARVIVTPGHTLGSISLCLADDSMMIGDAVINEIRVGMPLYGEDSELAYDSARKILAMRPRILYSGHGKPFSSEDLQRYFEVKSLSVGRLQT